MIEKLKDIKRILFGEFGYEFTSHPKAIAPVLLSVRGIIRNEKGEYLIMQRSRNDKHDNLMWEFPGGKVERGEFDPITVLIHEISEETNLKIETPKTTPYCIVREATTQVNSPYKNYTMVTLNYMCKPTSNNLKVSFEHEQYAWKTLESMKADLELSKSTHDILNSGFLSSI